MSEHDHHDDDHDHHDHHDDPRALRAEALESLLIERGIVDPAAVDGVLDYFEQQLGPQRGASVVAQAWVEPSFKQRLLEDGTGTVHAMGLAGPEMEHLVVVENTEHVHNVVVCTLCSCYPWALLGLPPSWYKSLEYRSRMVREPRIVLSEMGCELPDDVEVKVWDSSAEVRYLVLPQRPPDTDTLGVDDLAALVRRDHMIGVAR